MAWSQAVRVPRSEAEATRRRLLELGALRIDLDVAQDGEFVVFPVSESCGPKLPLIAFEFAPRPVRVRSYQDTLPRTIRERAPRAFETMGDIVIVKVPDDIWEHRGAIGEALLRFEAARAVFHDHGVQDPHRTRKLERIAGQGGSETVFRENGCEFLVDPAAAYFSPRLATERGRVAHLVQRGEAAVDLFGGVAPFGIQLALRGAFVHSVDLNPEATRLALENAKRNHVEDRIRCHTGDARDVARDLPKADRVIMNLPHGAKHFLDVAARCAKAGATIHYHEILPLEDAEKRAVAVAAELAQHGWKGKLVQHRVVRNYSPVEAHVAFDFVGVS